MTASASTHASTPAHGGTSRAYVPVSTGQLHLRRSAAGTHTRTPLVCLHMSPMSSYAYRSLIPALGTDRDVIAFDTPGFGMSDPPPAPPTIDDYAAVMFQGLDALEVSGPVDLIGYHTGSMTAAAMALAQPRRVRRIVMISAPVFTPAEREELRALFTKPMAVSEDGSHLSSAWVRFIEYSKGPGVSLEQVADVFPERLLGRTRSWWGHDAAFRYDYGSALARVTQPILVLNPRDDVWEYSPRAAPLLRNGRIQDLPDWGHGFLDVYTQQAAGLLREFLDG